MQFNRLLIPVLILLCLGLRAQQTVHTTVLTRTDTTDPVAGTKVRIVQGPTDKTVLTDMNGYSSPVTIEIDQPATITLKEIRSHTDTDAPSRLPNRRR